MAQGEHTCCRALMPLNLIRLMCCCFLNVQHGYRRRDQAMAMASSDERTPPCHQNLSGSMLDWLTLPLPALLSLPKSSVMLPTRLEIDFWQMGLALTDQNLTA